MTGLRIEIDLDKIAANARELVVRCATRGVTVTAVTKALLGAPELATVLDAVGTFADSRIENIERLRSAGIATLALLLRTPMPSQVERVIAADVMSVNTEIDVLSALSTAARNAGRSHDVMLMVELGDLREGVMPDRLHDTVRHVLGCRHLRLAGIGANLACRNGIAPSDKNMGQLSAIVESVEATFGVAIDIVSGGNSANLDWVFETSDVGRINDLRLGESLLLGREPLRRRPIPGLHTDAIVIVAEVIESNRKPTRPWGRAHQNSFGEIPEVVERGEVWQTILAIGRQDTETTDLEAPPGVEILAASSDHLVVSAPDRMRAGDEVRFDPGYAAVLRAMTSPFVAKRFVTATSPSFSSSFSPSAPPVERSPSSPFFPEDRQLI